MLRATEKGGGEGSGVLCSSRAVVLVEVEVHALRLQDIGVKGTCAREVGECSRAATRGSLRLPMGSCSCSLQRQRAHSPAPSIHRPRAASLQG